MFFIRVIVQIFSRGDKWNDAFSDANHSTHNHSLFVYYSILSRNNCLYLPFG